MRGLVAAAFATPAASLGAARRIVSLIPSLTEDLFAIGAGPQVVGVSAYTDFPAAATRLPIVGSFSSIDTERVVALRPDLVVGIAAQERLVRDLRRARLNVRLFADDTLAELYATLAALGRLSGRESSSARLAEGLRAQTRALVAAIPRGPAPSVFVVLGVRPTYTVGTGSYISELVALAGGRNAARVSQAYAQYSDEALVVDQPDVIVADPASGLAGVLDREPWRSLRAVRERRVFLLNDADILERPGPRFVQGLRWLIRHLHGPHAR